MPVVDRATAVVCGCAAGSPVPCAAIDIAGLSTATGDEAAGAV
jgi:hypothetical protein